MRGLDPRIHADAPLWNVAASARKPGVRMDCRVKPGNDGGRLTLDKYRFSPFPNKNGRAGARASRFFRCETDRSFADHLPGILSSTPFTYQFMLRIWLGSRWSPPLHSTVLPS